MTRRLVVLSAGVSTPSSTRLLADQLAGAVTAQVTARGEDLQVETIELRELAGDLAQMFATGLPTPRLDAARRAVSAADGLVAVTPVFAASYSGLFKMFVDALDPDSLTDLPVVIAATAGTARHSLVLDHALRPLFSYLRAVVVPTGVFAATEDFGGMTGARSAGDDSGAGLQSRVNRAAAQLAALMVETPAAVAGFAQSDVEPGTSGRGARHTRSAGVDVSAEVTPFDQLLAGHDG